ncbi:hypothetical protein JXQ70_06660 [bacterium]|nr:hypothetical protein [bacterium]
MIRHKPSSQTSKISRTVVKNSLKTILREKARLSQANPTRRFRTRFCHEGQEWVNQVFYADGWLCLHNQ